LERNYNATTARIYTDLSLLTANSQVTAAVTRRFQFPDGVAEIEL